MNNRHNVKEYTDLSVKAYDSQLLFVEFSNKGAQGEQGTVYLMFENGEVCHLNYLREGYGVLYGLCPMIKEWHVRSNKLGRFFSWVEILNEIVTPPGWAHQNLGCGNHLFVNKKVEDVFFKKTSSFHNPVEYYKNWFGIAKDIIKSMKISQKRFKLKTFWYRLIKVPFSGTLVMEEKAGKLWEIFDFIKWEDTSKTKQKRFLFNILSTDNSCVLCVYSLWLQKVEYPHAVVLIRDEGCQLLLNCNKQKENNEDVIVPDECLNSEIMKMMQGKIKAYIGEQCSRLNYKDVIHDYVRISRRLYYELKDTVCLKDYVWALMTAVDEDDMTYLDELNCVIGNLPSKDLLLKFDCSLLIADKMRNHSSSYQIDLKEAIKLIGYYEAALVFANPPFVDYILEEICKIVERYVECFYYFMGWNKDNWREKFWQSYLLGDLDNLTLKMSEIESSYRGKTWDKLDMMERLHSWRFDSPKKMKGSYRDIIWEIIVILDSLHSWGFDSLTQKLNEISPYGDKFSWDWIRNNAYCSGYFVRHDPIEYSVEYEKIEDEMEKKVEKLLADEQRGLGFCHIAWRVKHRVLRDCYGIWWRSVKDMHPSDCYE